VKSDQEQKVDTAPGVFFLIDRKYAGNGHIGRWRCGDALKLAQLRIIQTVTRCLGRHGDQGRTMQSVLSGDHTHGRRRLGHGWM
jgi:hypothetical protein